MAYQAANYDKPVPDCSGPFQIICPSETDLWSKPPSTHRANQPHIYQTTEKGKFKSAQVTISAQWKDLYDQGGLCLILVLEDGSRKWIKSGIERLDDEPFASTVAKDNFADFSLRPLIEESKATISLEIEHDALWIYILDEAGKKIPCREVTWWAGVPANTQLLVGPYACKPLKNDADLTVNFENLSIELAA